MDITGYAFVTGGGNGIGKACCLLFAELGASGVIVADINLEAAQQTVTEAKAVASNPNFRGEAIHVDVSKEESAKNAVAHTVRSFGRIDYCVHSAGIPPRTSDPLSSANFAEFQDLNGVHVNGTFLVVSAVSAAMASQEPKPVDASSPQRGVIRGTIVVLGSLASLITPPGMVQYSTAKHAVLGLAKSAAIENGPLHIRVNCICPAWIETPLLRRTMDAMTGLDDDALVANIPMGRIGTTKEVAQSAIYLCSSWSSFMTGHALVLDGGMSIL
ncbi:hypothetical protein GGR54DRAFT_640544 [Hypoxylon sp. NC1633]|nr:hypothetical protein GGR54DRAFT_640544 [Hypoxylon sp. NC1633]